MKKEELATFLALQNAVKFKGKANPKALIGGIVAQFPEFTSNMKELMELINEAVTRVNALSEEEQKKEILAINPNYFTGQAAAKEERKEQRKELPELKNVTGPVVTRMPPEPSKYNHLGHALSFLINYLYAKKYDGTCILRFEDTNPEKEKQEFVDAMHEDVLEYLGITPSKILVVSDDMGKFYAAAEELITQGKVYTCDCQNMSEQRRKAQECEHRAENVEATQTEWNAMKAGTSTHVLRLRIDMAHKNAVMRDPVIMRVIPTPHYRQGEKYKVWPLYDFENALEDSWNGITHVIRSNEFQDRIELHNYIKDLFGLPHQEVQQYGRFNITGTTTQGREIREKIEKKEVIGWDDPRLITLKALQRRGIVKESFYELAKQCGMSKTQTNLDFSVLAAINRQILDETANRYFFIEDPVEIDVKNWPTELRNVELKLHPHNQRGGRPLTLNGKFNIAKKDYEQIQEGQVVRLIDTANLLFQDGTFTFHSASIEEFRKEKNKYGLIHFLPCEEGEKARIFMDDATYREGIVEKNTLTIGENVQFERYCFARLDSLEEMPTFWFSHP